MLDFVLFLLNTVSPVEMIFSNNIFKCHFLNENIRSSNWILLKSVPVGPINVKLILIQVMDWWWKVSKPWLKQIMMTSSNWKIFCITGHLCGEFTSHREYPLTKANEVELVFSLIGVLNKRLSKQSWGCWFEMPSHSLWRHCNEWPGFLMADGTTGLKWVRIPIHKGRQDTHQLGILLIDLN